MGTIKKVGFTLIEVMVVIAVIGMVLPLLFSLVFSIMNAQLKVMRLSQVKREGDFAITSIENIIRNKTVHIYQGDCSNYAAYSGYTEQCASGTSSYSPVSPSTFCILDDDGHGLYYSLSSSRIASNSAITNASANLTTTAVSVSNLAFSCSRASDFSPPIINLSFDVCYGDCSATRAEEMASIHYQTAVKLHNY